MAKQKRRRWKPVLSWLRGTVVGVRRQVVLAWRTLCRRCRSVQVEVLTSDDHKRRGVQWELRNGLGQLRRVLGSKLPEDLTIVVQEVLQADPELAGSHQLAERDDGSRFVIVRLALQISGRPRTADELLAELAEQCFAVASPQPVGPAASPQATSAVSEMTAARPLVILPPDPLIPHSNGTGLPERMA